MRAIIIQAEGGGAETVEVFADDPFRAEASKPAVLAADDGDDIGGGDPPECVM